MKLSLGAVLVPLLALGIAMTTGCAGTAQSVNGTTAASAASTPVGTTSITSATLAPSGLAPATWDGDDAAPSAAAAPSAPSTPIAQPTWGAAVVVGSPTN